MAHSKYYGVTKDKRVNKFKAQVFIAGKPRFLGYFEKEIDAAKVAETARVRLAEYFSKPAPLRKFDPEASTQAMEDLREHLRRHKAETFNHGQTNSETPAQTLKRLRQSVRKTGRIITEMEKHFTRGGGFSSP